MRCRLSVALGRRGVNGVNAVKQSFGICRPWDRRPASSEGYEQPRSRVLYPALVKFRPGPDGRKGRIADW